MCVLSLMAKTHLAVRMIHDQQESKQEMERFHQDIIRAIESHKPRPEVQSQCIVRISFVVNLAASAQESSRKVGHCDQPTNCMM